MVQARCLKWIPIRDSISKLFSKITILSQKVSWANINFSPVSWKPRERERKFVLEAKIPENLIRNHLIFIIRGWYRILSCTAGLEQAPRVMNRVRKALDSISCIEYVRGEFVVQGLPLRGNQSTFIKIFVSSNFEKRPTLIIWKLPWSLKIALWMFQTNLMLPSSVTTFYIWCDLMRYTRAIIK